MSSNNKKQETPFKKQRKERADIYPSSKEINGVNNRSIRSGESRMVMAVAFWAIPELNMAKILKAAAKDTITTGIVILSTSQPGNTGNKSTPPTITTARFDKPNIVVLILRLSTI